MKRYQSGAEKRKKFKQTEEFLATQKNSMHKFLNVHLETQQPTANNNEEPTAQEIEKNKKNNGEHDVEFRQEAFLNKT